MTVTIHRAFRTETIAKFVDILYAVRFFSVFFRQTQHFLCTMFYGNEFRLGIFARSGRGSATAPSSPADR
jgi:hypothetical protein